MHPFDVSGVNFSHSQLHKGHGKHIISKSEIINLTIRRFSTADDSWVFAYVYHYQTYQIFYVNKPWKIKYLQMVEVEQEKTAAHRSVTSMNSMMDPVQSAMNRCQILEF